MLDPVEEAQANLDCELARLARRKADYQARWDAGGHRANGPPPSTGGQRVTQAVARLAKAQAAAKGAADPPGATTPITSTSPISTVG